MAPPSRDRITVDLHGLKAALFERALALGVSPSGVVRSAVTAALDGSNHLMIERPREISAVSSSSRVRISLRMSREQAAETLEAARRAGLSPGDYVAGMVAGVPALMGGPKQTEYIAALVASSAELSTLTRNIHHRTALLRQGESRAAREYRDMLDTLAGDVRGHLMLAARVLADLRPCNRLDDARQHHTT
jgi:hypothetical protein